jgi:hypothetical protein
MRFRREDLRVEGFEYVEVGAGLALLRLAGVWRAGAPDGARLLALRDGAEEELAALPEPPDDGTGVWRAAFSAGTEVLDGRTDFRLEAADGRTVELPAPVERGVRAAEPVAAEAEPEAYADPEAYAEPEPAEPGRFAEPARNGAGPLHAQPDAHALDAAERALRVERARHERAEAGLREQLRVMVGETADFMGRLEGYEMRRAELEKELSWERLLHKETRRLQDEAERERDEAIERLGPVEEELARVRREVEAAARSQRRLVDARERIAELERQLELQEGLLDTARTVAERGSSQLAALEERLVRLRDEADRLPAAASNGHAPQPAVSGPQQELIDRVFEEADRGTERLAWLERRVGELRDGIAAQAVAEPQARPRGRGRRFRR